MVTRGAIHAEIADCRMLIEELPLSRERSLALTKLDEAEMWADRAPVDDTAEPSLSAELRRRGIWPDRV